MDVEYVSELFIGMAAGPQDKKKLLDDFYESFEMEMPDGSLWEGDFRKTRSLIERVFSPSEIRKWSGKSDFYSLFFGVQRFA